jgi:uncharacterized protein (TIGR03435 family)
VRVASLIAIASTVFAAASPVASRTMTAQTPPAFDVASVRQNTSTGGPRIWRFHPGGRFTATNMPLRALIRIAYGHDTIRINAQMDGAPRWVDTDRFDIEAKAEGEIPADPDGVSRQGLAMLRTLLEERFKIKAHFETRQLPVFALMMADGPGKLGPQLTASTAECGARVVLAAATAAPARASAPAPATAAAAGAPAGTAKCFVSSTGPGAIEARGVTMGEVAAGLSLFPAVDRIVFDRTALNGRFDLRLKYVPALVAGQQRGAFVANPDIDSGPSLLTAMREQLGLKLQPEKGPVDVLVLDHIEPLAAEQP